MQKMRKLAAVCAFFFIALCFCSTMSYAVEIPDEPPDNEPEITVETESVVPEPEPEVFIPVIPDGTGTVIDVFEGEDGRKFYTIQTPAGNTFYLIIDFTRTSNNVYFLGAVTEKDLLALAEKSGNGVTSVSAIPDTNTQQISEPTLGDQDDPKPEDTGNSGSFSMILVVLIVLVGGGAGFYFKIYLPKKNADNSRDEYEGEDDDYDSGDGEYDAEPEDDLPWEE